MQERASYIHLKELGGLELLKAQYHQKQFSKHTLIVFFNANALQNLPLDAYFLAAMICVILALISKKILIHLALSLVCFYVLYYFLS